MASVVNRIAVNQGTPPPMRAVECTFEFSFPLPTTRRDRNTRPTAISKNHPQNKPAGQPPKGQTHGKSSRKTPPAAIKPKPPPQSKTNHPSEERDPATQEAKRQERQNYERSRSRQPERMEYQRLHKQKSRQKAMALGLCKSCPNPAIPGRTRCQHCAEKHQESRRRSRTRQKAMAEQKPTEDV